MIEITWCQFCGKDLHPEYKCVEQHVHDEGVRLYGSEENYAEAMYRMDRERAGIAPKRDGQEKS